MDDMNARKTDQIILAYAETERLLEYVKDWFDDLDDARIGKTRRYRIERKYGDIEDTIYDIRRILHTVLFEK